MKERKKILFLVFLLVVMGVVIFLYFSRMSPEQKWVTKCKEQYGISLEYIGKTSDGVAEYQMEGIDHSFTMDPSAEDFPEELDRAIKEHFFERVKTEHENLTFDHGAYILTFQNYSNIEEATAAVNHIAEYLMQQSYFKKDQHFGFIRVDFTDGISSESSVEICIGNPKSGEYYEDRMYQPDTLQERLANHYIDIANQYSYEDPSIPMELYHGTIAVSDGTNTTYLSHYNGYFTFEMAVQVLTELGYEVHGDASNFNVFAHDDIYEFSRSFIEGPHTYYIYNGDHYTLSNQEDMISEDIFSEVIGTQVQIRNGGRVEQVLVQDNPSELTFGIDPEKQTPYLYVGELWKLFDALGISDSNTHSFYQEPLYTWEKGESTYTFDLSYSNYYRNQKGIFVSEDDTYYILNGNIKEELPEYENNHFYLSDLERITGWTFSYDSSSNTLSIVQ